MPLFTIESLIAALTNWVNVNKLPSGSIAIDTTGHITFCNRGLRYEEYDRIDRNSASEEVYRYGGWVVADPVNEGSLWNPYGGPDGTGDYVSLADHNPAPINDNTILQSIQLGPERYDALEVYCPGLKSQDALFKTDGKTVWQFSK